MEKKIIKRKGRIIKKPDDEDEEEYEEVERPDRKKIIRVKGKIIRLKKTR